MYWQCTLLLRIGLPVKGTMNLWYHAQDFSNLVIHVQSNHSKELPVFMLDMLLVSLTTNNHSGSLFLSNKVTYCLSFEFLISISSPPPPYDMTQFYHNAIIYFWFHKINAYILGYHSAFNIADITKNVTYKCNRTKCISSLIPTNKLIECVSVEIQ